MPLIIGSDASDEEILDSVGKDGNMGLPVGGILEPARQRAFDRVIENDWLRLIDIVPAMVNGTPALARKFRITDAGRARLKEIKERQRINGLVGSAK